jgi:magnesium transporter
MLYHLIFAQLPENYGTILKNIDHQTIEIRHPEQGAWINVLPPLKQEEFEELSEALDIPIDFLRDSLDIDERSYEIDDNNKLM